MRYNESELYVLFRAPVLAKSVFKLKVGTSTLTVDTVVLTSVVTSIGALINAGTASGTGTGSCACALTVDTVKL